MPHTDRIKRDRNGDTSIETSIGLRLEWACGSWVEPMNSVVSYFAGQQALLREWAILRPAGGRHGRGPIAPGELGLAPDIVDEFLLTKFEAMARIFLGLQARAMCLWRGGIYSAVKLLSEDTCQEAAMRAAKVHRASLAVEEFLANGPPGDEHEAVKSFESERLWNHSVVYRELLGLVAEDELDAARFYAWQLHSSVCHEKGLHLTSD